MTGVPNNRMKNPVANPSVILNKEFDDWAVLFDTETGNALGINPVGIIIWQLMDGNKSVEEIVNQIKNMCSDVPDTVNEEIKEFIDMLLDAGFVGYELTKDQLINY